MPVNLSAPAPPTGASSDPLESDRTSVLEVLSQIELPTPPAVALQVVQAAGRRNCTSTELVALLAQDPTLCAKLLRVVNSCVYGLSKQIASLEAAVHVLGLNPLRSLILSLSLPAVHVAGPISRSARRYGVASVSGGMIARELAIQLKLPLPEDVMMAGLLRDLGRQVLDRGFPEQARAVYDTRSGDLPDRITPAERAAFGIDHTELTAHLLQTWGLPKEIVEPIRHHHRPEGAAALGTLIADRAELLYFVEHLVCLDAVADDREALRGLLDRSETRYRLKKDKLIAFLQSIAPKVAAFAAVLDADITGFPDLAKVLSEGAETLIGLTVEANRAKVNDGSSHVLTRRDPATPPPAQSVPGGSMLSDVARAIQAAPPSLAVVFQNHPRYKVLEKIGEGGMGAVYKAEHKLMGRAVAIKVMASRWVADGDAVERFRREVRLAARLNHPNIVTAHDADEVDGLQCLVMEYVDGRSLHRLVTTDGPVAVPLACRLVAQTAQGLHHAFEQGMVHRDIKPHNLMLTPAGQVKILDFGLARLTLDAAAGDADAGLTGPQDIIGTPDYLAPEQARNSSAVDHRTDLYGLGCTLFFLLAGHPPFNKGSSRDRMFAHLEQQPPPLATVRPDAPPGLQTVLDRLLAKSPAARYQTATELVAALEPFLSATPAPAAAEVRKSSWLPWKWRS